MYKKVYTILHCSNSLKLHSHYYTQRRECEGCEGRQCGGIDVAAVAQINKFLAVHHFEYEHLGTKHQSIINPQKNCGRVLTTLFLISTSIFTHKGKDINLPSFFSIQKFESQNNRF